MAVGLSVIGALVAMTWNSRGPPPLWEYDTNDYKRQVTKPTKG